MYNQLLFVVVVLFFCLFFCFFCGEVVHHKNGLFLLDDNPKISHLSKVYTFYMARIALYTIKSVFVYKYCKFQLVVI